MKHTTITIIIGYRLSPPMRGRGLKPIPILHNPSPGKNVAPHAGARIETGAMVYDPDAEKSPPMRGRGLKLLLYAHLTKAL